MGLRTALLLVMIAAVLCAPAFAAGSFPDNKPLPEPISAKAETKTQASTPAPAETSAVEPVGKLLVGLGVFALIFFGLVWLVRRNPGLRRYLGTGGPLRILSRVHLGSRQQVYLIRVGERLIVVGGGQNLTTLSEIRDPAEVARLTAETSSPAGKEFKQALRASIADAEREPADRPVAPSDRFKPTTDVLDRALVGVSGAAREKLAAIRAELERMTAEAQRT
ncbi:MAG: flagellar biosynthetic protein FliO [Planctomycetes bacterium]|nr:flagellar biosynthetic protein FliO [Planctomycetota bacterium]